MSKNRGIVLVACIPVTVKIQEPDLTPEDFDKLVESLRKSVVMRRKILKGGLIGVDIREKVKAPVEVKMVVGEVKRGKIVQLVSE